MPGNETKNFDFVMEFAEQAIQDIIGVLFDAGGLLDDIIANTINHLPGVEVPPGAFTLGLSFDRPADIAGFPAGAENPIDLRIGLGPSGSLGSMRVVVGLDVNRTAETDHDVVQINFKDKLYYAGASIGPVGGQWSVLENWLRDHLAERKLFSVEVDRAATDPKKIKRADVAVIDDTSAQDRDALAWCLTFGGGSPGPAAAFTRSFIPDGGTGAVAIFFGWLCRMITPIIIDKLKIPADAFTNCKLTRSVTIKDGDGDDVKLTKLELSLKDGFIQVDAAVEKSGFCYTAKGKVSARIRIEINDGQLIVQSEIDDPDIDVDVPWYCYLAAAIIGLLTGGLFGVVWAVVGAVIGPLIMYIVQEVIEGQVQDLASGVTDAINAVSPDVQVKAVGINLIFQRVFIDDITIGCRVQVIDNSPVRVAGSAVLRPGQSLDLDTGSVRDGDEPPADLKWTGAGPGRKLETVCISEMARTGSRSLNDLSRFRLYNCPYQNPLAISVGDLEEEVDLIIIRYSRPTLNVYAVRTNEGRYAAVQAVEVSDSYIRLAFKTFEKRLPVLQILGDFPCEQVVAPPKGLEVLYEAVRPPKTVEERLGVLSQAVLSRATADLGPEGMPLSLAAGRRLEGLEAQLPAALLAPRTLSAAGSPPAHLARMPMEVLAPAAMRVGRWTGRYTVPRKPRGRFEALGDGLQLPASYRWYLNGTYLDAESGSVNAGMVKISYQVAENVLILELDRPQELRLELRVAAVDARGFAVEKIRCVRYSPACRGRVRFIPDWDRYRSAYMANFGIVEEAAVTPFRPLAARE